MSGDEAVKVPVLGSMCETAVWGRRVSAVLPLASRGRSSVSTPVPTGKAEQHGRGRSPHMTFQFTGVCLQKKKSLLYGIW